MDSQKVPYGQSVLAREHEVRAALHSPERMPPTDRVHPRVYAIPDELGRRRCDVRSSFKVRCPRAASICHSLEVSSSSMCQQVRLLLVVFARLLFRRFGRHCQPSLGVQVMSTGAQGMNQYEIV